LLAGLATLAGVSLDAALQDELAELITGAANLIAGALAWYGRATAHTALTWRRK
jgi:hypothetical protein